MKKGEDMPRWNAFVKSVLGDDLGRKKGKGRSKQRTDKPVATKKGVQN